VVENDLVGLDVQITLSLSKLVLLRELMNYSVIVSDLCRFSGSLYHMLPVLPPFIQEKEKK
jgi:hypothetical protein